MSAITAGDQPALLEARARLPNGCSGQAVALYDLGLGSHFAAELPKPARGLLFTQFGEPKVGRTDLRFWKLGAGRLACLADAAQQVYGQDDVVLYSHIPWMNETGGLLVIEATNEVVRVGESAR
jgi:hypothetical protein